MSDYTNPLSDCTKPPLGAAPAYIRSGERIKELADAISRASNEAEHYVGTIAKWSREILMQVEIIRAMDPYEHQTMSATDCRGAE